MSAYVASLPACNCVQHLDAPVFRRGFYNTPEIGLVPLKNDKNKGWPTFAFCKIIRLSNQKTITKMHRGKSVRLKSHK